MFGSALYAVRVGLCAAGRVRAPKLSRSSPTVGWLLISFVTRTALGLLLVVAASPALVCHALPHTEGVVGL